MKNEQFHGVEMHVHGAEIRPADLTVPDFSVLELFVEPFSVENGLGQPALIGAVLREFQADLAAAVGAIQRGEPLPRLFVPDLWHVTFGTAKLFRTEEANFLHNTQTFAVRLGRQFYPACEPDVSHNYPGTAFVPA